MSNVVFILGAGASVNSGGPTMSNFLDKAKGLLLSKQLAGDSRKHFETVFKVIGKLQVVHSKAQLDLKHIESIFTAIELGRIIESVPGLEGEAEISDAITALKSLIVVTLENKVLFERNGDRTSDINSHSTYVEFARLLRDIKLSGEISRTVSVITFNYDLAVDVAMQMAQIGPDYIIQECPGMERSQQVELMKLHGSLNWAIESVSRQIRPMHMVDYFDRSMPYYDIQDNKVRTPIGSNLTNYLKRFHPHMSFEPTPVIVPPSWNKSDYHRTLTQVWKSAAKNLSEAEYIFICGYSLPETDSFFRHLFALGSVGDNPLQCIEVFDPAPDDAVKNRFQSMLGSGAKQCFDFHRLEFGPAINCIRKRMGNPVAR